ncbi:putative manganese-dependent inorganic diphosphatase [Sedimentibacter sp. MB31-C6]|uniref:putative manganese-dependent inorganic diphosphatase n=1 Tax=Sedimentibacter sp. MB31-C6 TaxID=3109366 RepID=UPI002DDD9226|nr:putative manganese-dependent inorganic diphosphatase [Sedimentibacter sp. MB36-C1]WSI05386.1 putative manganese-dependent inorganic diphosphatase [Sedimentibacter sp. MB36-C1]
MKNNLIFGHKTPDTDSVCSAITLSNLKNKINEPSIPYILDNITKETEFVLNYFNVKTPNILTNVKIQIKDLSYDKVKPFKLNQSVHFAYFFMNENKLRTLPIIDDDGKLAGIITMKDIAMSLINTDQKYLCTSYDNIIETLIGSELLRFDNIIEGNITVASFEEKTLRNSETLNENSIVIVGDRYDVIKYAIELGVKLIIVTGDFSIPLSLLDLAKKNKINLIKTPFHTYYTAKNVSLSKYVNHIMKTSGLMIFTEDDYLEDCKEDIEQSKHSKFPIISRDKKYLGLLSRNHLINPSRKKVILVDHNEMGQSADGIEEAEILEVIDHHKIGDIKTPIPISFRNTPVGSTNTIIYQMYKENNIKIEKPMAGLMLSGIISDTLLLKSPTTTDADKIAVENLSKIVELDLYKYAMDMFKAGTSLESKSIEEVLYQDFKKFNLEYKNIGISQVFTLDINQIMINENDYINLIDNITLAKDYFMIIMAVTDIVNEGSYIFYTSDKEKIVKLIFNIEDVHQGIYIDKCVSRKKQIVPSVINAIKQMN